MKSPKRKRPKKITKAEEAFVRDMVHTSAFEKLDRGQAKLLPASELPEPLKRFLDRERTTVHIRLPAPARRRLDSLSQTLGVSVDELAKRWVQEALAREVG